MTPLQQVRLNLDDHIQIGFAVELSLGNMQVYQMNNHNIWDLVVKNSDGEVIPQEVEGEDDNYEVFPQSGQIKGNFPEGEVTFEYKYAGFTDEELTHYLDTNLDSVNKATLDCVNILLASAAKRFDYKAGLKDIKASQVYDHLKDLRATFQSKVESEDQAGDHQVPVFIDRVHPAYSTTRNLREDISRSDQ